MVKSKKYEKLKPTDAIWFENPNVVSQVIIIGNGADLEAGLCSKYSDFYKDRYTEPLLASMDNVFTENEYLKNVTVWDLILARKNKDVEMTNWSDIESLITDVLMRDSLESEDYPENLRNGWMKHSILSLLVTVGLNYTKYSIYKTILVVQIVKILDFKYSYIEELQSRDTTDSQLFYTVTLLLKELNAYESFFIEYLFRRSMDSNYLIKAERLIDELIIADLPDLEFNEIVLKNRLLNFNYTRPFGDDEEQRFYVQRNVHGSLDTNNIIFGVDELANDAERSNPLFAFSKTYRIMSLSGETYLGRGLLDDDVEIIKFYGHSLSAADYSYFQAMFDSVDLYSGKTELYFYFRIRDGFNEEDLLQEMNLNVSLLLERYGSSNGNDVRGRNLLTKLNLESRLHVKILPKIQQYSDYVERKNYVTFDQYFIPEI
ncbi:hypothetical protein C6P11_06900 [Weissella confusa]|uniref:Uncharacterized protein n=1 Tax=Weissella confusa TaxID=1583 RepID=A0A4Z0RZE0_WEICO|nr:hypothetical protein C6P11_06900 [Weissella confusa]